MHAISPEAASSQMHLPNPFYILGSSNAHSDSTNAERLGQGGALLCVQTVWQALD